MAELIVKDNALINASYSLSLVEQRLILLAVITTRKHEHNKELDYWLGKPIIIKADDYIANFGVAKQTAYESLKTACASLFERRFSYQEKRSKGVANVVSRWVSNVAYIDAAATVEITLAPPVLPLITRLEQHFTSYELEQVKDLTSVYAIRLYELLICWRSTGKTPQITLTDLRDRLGVVEGDYKRMGQFKEKVLNFAISQINEHTDITASYDQHKTGRSISGFTFNFKVKKNKKVIAEIGKRDCDSGDLFTTDGLSDKQLGRIARNQRFKADYNHLVSPTSAANHDNDAWQYEMINLMKKEPSKFNKRPIREYLD